MIHLLAVVTVNGGGGDSSSYEWGYGDDRAGDK